MAMSKWEKSKKSLRSPKKKRSSGFFLGVFVSFYVSRISSAVES